MSFTRFLAWLFAVALSAGAGLVGARYGFGVSSWGDDAFWMAVTAILATRRVSEALIEMWSR